ncbi:MAG: PAS domain-containing sensor histidine kinase [Desulfuromonas sp.]|nr:MAG: PAS domain-containing sensor histidine kinase [Desulfuromonas sp.]
MSGALHEISAQNSSRKLINWYLAVRLVVVCFFLGGTIVFQLREASWETSLVARCLAYLTAAAILQTTLSSAILGHLRRFRLFIHLQLSWDLLFVLLVIYMTGGQESHYSFLFILVIIAASLFLPRSQLLIVASASSILFGSLLDLQFFGYLPMFGERAYPQGLQQSEVFYAVFLHVGAFFLTALLSGSLAERLRVSEEAREQREIDYAELERLNQAILSNINSGLMIINTQGRIRSFNQAASRMTGYRLDQVYNRPLKELFPEFDQVDPSSVATIERGEAFYRQGETDLTLGYSASQVQDSHGVNLGLLIAFQDLTEYKILEEQLKRNDRLAAVGRLASGLAHEIRNPLASISGSVQLLAEDAQISEENRRLMGIVVKEADRLSQLLSNFLNFARPTPLQLECIDLSLLLNELTDLLQAGGQAGQVEILKSFSQKMVMQVDRQKIRQSLWDLLLNAVEASQPTGEVLVLADSAAGLITIEDSGPGILESDRDKIFEPFFTTKDRGTGLGLANVYANIEAHEGRVYVEPSNLGGARFIIELPPKCRQAC